jgi:hypothetical protein
MGLNTSEQQFVKSQSLNDLNRYLLYFPAETPKHLDQDEIIEILDQAKAPQWHEAMVNSKIDNFEMSYISIILMTWRRSGTPTVPILPHCQ